MSHFQEIADICSSMCSFDSLIDIDDPNVNQQLHPLYPLLKNKRMFDKIFVLSSLVDVRAEIKEKTLYYNSGKTKSYFVQKNRNIEPIKIAKKFNTIDSFMKSLGCDKKIAQFLGDYFFDIFKYPKCQLCCVGFEEGELVSSFNIFIFTANILDCHLPIVCNFIKEGKSVQHVSEFVNELNKFIDEDEEYNSCKYDIHFDNYEPVNPPDPDDIIQPLSWWKRLFS